MVHRLWNLYNLSCKRVSPVLPEHWRMPTHMKHKVMRLRFCMKFFIWNSLRLGTANLYCLRRLSEGMSSSNKIGCISFSSCIMLIRHLGETLRSAACINKINHQDLYFFFLFWYWPAFKFSRASNSSLATEFPCDLISYEFSSVDKLLVDLVLLVELESLLGRPRLFCGVIDLGLPRSRVAFDLVLRNNFFHSVFPAWKWSFWEKSWVELIAEILLWNCNIQKLYIVTWKLRKSYLGWILGHFIINRIRPKKSSFLWRWIEFSVFRFGLS